MTPEEMTSNLVRACFLCCRRISLIKPQKGTLAKSGTAEFLTQAESNVDATNSNLIGAFGLGFYSRCAPLDSPIRLPFS
jgi:hypothetical protein